MGLLASDVVIVNSLFRAIRIRSSPRMLSKLSESSSSSLPARGEPLLDSERMVNVFEYGDAATPEGVLNLFFSRSYMPAVAPVRLRFEDEGEARLAMPRRRGMRAGMEPTMTPMLISTMDQMRIWETPSGDCQRALERTAEEERILTPQVLFGEKGVSVPETDKRRDAREETHAEHGNDDGLHARLHLHVPEHDKRQRGADKVGEHRSHGQVGPDEVGVVQDPHGAVLRLEPVVGHRVAHDHEPDDAREDDGKGDDDDGAEEALDPPCLGDAVHGEADARLDEEEAHWREIFKSEDCLRHGQMRLAREDGLILTCAMALLFIGGMSCSCTPTP